MAMMAPVMVLVPIASPIAQVPSLTMLNCVLVIVELFSRRAPFTLVKEVPVMLRPACTFMVPRFWCWAPLRPKVVVP